MQLFMYQRDLRTPHTIEIAVPAALDGVAGWTELLL